MPTLGGWFLQTSVPHIPKMGLCFSIFKRGSATASTQLLHESGAQWKRALQESICEASWMLWRRITRYHASSSNTTSMSIYRNSKISGLFNGTACFTSPRSPERGVDMFRNTWCASVKTELSKAPAAWTYVSGETLSETTTNMLDFSANHSCIPPFGCWSRPEGLPQQALGVNFLCRYPRMAASIENKSAESSLAGEGVNLMSNLSELHR